jgi:hypothetical protein
MANLQDTLIGGVIARFRYICCELQLSEKEYQKKETAAAVK